MLPKILVALVIIIVLAVAGFIYKGPPSGGSTNENKTSDVTWETDDNGWRARGNPPECPSPLILATPIDLSLVTGILYPGQSRSGDYKAHGGFRFDSSSNDDIIVKVPMDAVISDASRYIEMGEVQYMFDFVHACGIRYRFDHLLVLAPKFAKIAEGLPPAKIDDSRTTRVDPPVSVTTGEIIATSIGFRETKNVGVDFGVYDLRKKNHASQDSNWASQHPIHDQYAVCWFDLLSPEDGAKVKSLPPGDSKNGSKSDYCKP